ncbi:hypothetical protein BTA51_12690 [Hahella sp. CCB-MM4]|uniref:DUF4156 domain-containing protein n=1 Tax=Hahella sp. (strain CCB-MM4) TaxID=1926491 RepID=UPI000B9AE981|nr:DUF4156 domain-containing protein [Hahella sp. CCB-MM4]OZG72830.1 hypothetical protein BTA51_12690 [Hahella sp. CCB-MM4]
MNKLKFVPILAVLTVASCATVKPTPGSENVKLLTTEEASQCERLGTASAQVLDKVGFLPRGEAPMADELLVLAKNEAIKMGGNALATASEIIDGTREYIIYNCQ